jgi:glutathione S-transferase
MLELYGVARSRATRNLWLLYETGQPFVLHRVIQAYRANPENVLTTQSPEFLAISPAGAVPVLKDGDLVVSESLAINLYLAKKAGAPIGPKDAGEEALMTQWALYATCSVEPFAVKIMYAHSENRAATDAGRTEIAAMSEALVRPLGVLDAHLAKHGHLVGGRFSVADINMAEIVRYAGFEPGHLEKYPNVKRWYDACQARPAFKTMWEQRLAEPM